MKLKLLEYLQCFNCGGSFSLNDEMTEGSEIISGCLVCSGCSLIFPILRGVPRMLPKEQGETNKSIAERFGYEWKSFAEFFDFYREQFLGWIKPVKPDFFRDKVVLDGGCGKGRHIRLAAEFGAKEVIGVDLSEAVEVAYNATKQSPNVHVIQADIFHLPLKQKFDYAYSIGVLDHTTDPYLAFSSLVKLLAPGGSISAWVYGKEGNGWITGLVDPIRKTVTSRAPLWFVKALAFSLASILFATINVIYKPLNKNKFTRKFLFYRDYLISIENFPFREMMSITFDHLVAPKAYYLSAGEVTGWFKKEQLKNVVLTRHNQNSWCGFGTK